MRVSSPDSPVHRYRLKRGTLQANAYATDAGFVVTAGSESFAQSAPSITRSNLQLRALLRSVEGLVPTTEPKKLVFAKDTTFRNASEAAAVVLGCAANGVTEWIGVDGAPPPRAKPPMTFAFRRKKLGKKLAQIAADLQDYDEPEVVRWHTRLLAMAVQIAGDKTASSAPELDQINNSADLALKIRGIMPTNITSDTSPRAAFEQALETAARMVDEMAAAAAEPLPTVESLGYTPEDNEVVGIDRNGYLLHWASAEGAVYNSQETLEQYGLGRLNDREMAAIARVRAPAEQ